jgi:hypothetical protein
MEPFTADNLDIAWVNALDPYWGIKNGVISYT